MRRCKSVSVRSYKLNIIYYFLQVKRKVFQNGMKRKCLQLKTSIWKINTEDQTNTSITSQNRKQLFNCNQFFLIFYKHNFSNYIWVSILWIHNLIIQHLNPFVLILVQLSVNAPLIYRPFEPHPPSSHL